MKTRDFLVFLFFLLPLTGCVPPGKDLRGLDRFLREEGKAALDNWNFSRFSSSQREVLGDETSLAAALLLRDLDREQEAQAILRRILQEGEAPWKGEAVWELASLLEDRGEWGELETLLLEEPNLKENPGLTEGLYRALANQGKLKILEELLALQEEDRPLLTAIAAVVSGADDVEERMMTIAEARPAGLEFDQLYALLGGEDRKGPAGRLIEAKAALHRGEALAASKELLSLAENPGMLTPALVDDLVTLYRKIERLQEGAILLEGFAQSGLWSGGGGRRAGTETFAFGAGRLYRWAGNREKAAESFLLALEKPPPGEGERILWYLLDSLLAMDPPGAPEILAAYAPLWEDPSYYEDILDRLFAKLLSLRAGETVVETASLVEKYGSPKSRAQGAYLSARVEELGWIAPSQPAELDVFYRRALRLDPTGIYGWHSRYHLDDWNSLPGTAPPARTREDLRDLPLKLCLDLALLDRAMARWNRLGGSGTIEDKRRVTTALQEEGRYLDSLRFLGGVGAEDPPQAWRLRYPRGYRNLIEGVARENALPAPLLFALVRSESGFTADIESWAGAVGLAQLMPATAEDVASRMNRPLGDLTDPRENLELGGWYLQWLIDYVGAPWSAVLAYNGGPGRVRRWLKEGDFLPPDLAVEAVPLRETRNYGRNLLVAALYYGYLYYEVSAKEMLSYFFQEFSR